MAPRKALIAEDNATVLDLIETAVRALGFEVKGVRDGAEAQELIFDEHPDLLVADLALPAVHGSLLISTLKGLNRRAKVVAISGMGQAAESDALRAGADVFFAKPFARADLERALAELFRDTR